jgi:hypothetical protein
MTQTDILDLFFTTGPEIEHTFISKTGQHVYILIEPHPWGYSTSVVLDSGDILHKKFIDYTPEEIIETLTEETEELLMA